MFKKKVQKSHAMTQWLVGLVGLAGRPQTRWELRVEWPWQTGGQAKVEDPPEWGNPWVQTIWEQFTEFNTPALTAFNHL